VYTGTLLMATIQSGITRHQYASGIKYGVH
jgi:hypothetical protein